MRDLIVTGTVLILLPFCLARPWIGVLVWSWLGYMNPHRLAWGFATTLPFAMLAAVATMTGLLFAKDQKPIPWVRETYLLAALWLMYTVTTFFALYPDEAWAQWSKVSKVLLFTFITMKLFQDRQRLRDLFLVIALSIGFYGVKGGIWAIATGGQNRVYGPDLSFLGSNNSIGLALNMVLPFLYILQQDERRRWLRNVLRVTFWLSIVAIIFTYSRGAFLGAIVVLTLLFLKGSRRFLGGVAILALVALLFVTVGSSLIPEQWWDRMASIITYQQDDSALGRFDAWRVAFLIALDRPFVGGGFWALPHPDTYFYHGYESHAPLSAHSIYFSVLGDHGFIGLALFVSLILSCLWSLRGLRRRMAKLPEGNWMVAPTKMLEVSFVAYMVSGAFLTEAYFDLFYHLVSAVIILKTLARQLEAAPATSALATTQPAVGTARLIARVRRAPDAARP